MRAQVDKLLTNVSNMYSIQNTIAQDLLPMLKQKQSTGIIGGYGKGHLRTENDLMGGRSEARRVDAVEYDLSQIYHIKNHGLEEVVTQDDYDNVEQPFDAEVDKTEAVTSIILINREIIARNTIMDSAVITQGQTLVGSDKFSDSVNSDPLGVAKDAATTMLASCGHVYNTIVMSKTTYLNLRYHPQILDALGYKFDRAGLLTAEEMCRAFDCEKILIGDASYNSAKKGQTDSLVQIWTDDMLFYYRPVAAAKKQVSLGYMIKKLSGTERSVYKYPLNNPPGATGIIVEDNYDFRLVNPLAGYLVQGTY